jgi:FkbM family methyltransferase
VAKRATLIIATLMRPSLQATLRCLQAQTLPRSEWDLITWGKTEGDPNEYSSRNHAEVQAKAEVLAFTDDDTEPPPDWLENGVKHFEADPELMLLTGPIEGDMWGQGWMKLDKRGWFVGANLWVRKSAFEAVGGFEATWGLDPPPRGWRGDSVPAESPVIVREGADRNAPISIKTFEELWVMSGEPVETAGPIERKAAKIWVLSSGGRWTRTKFVSRHRYRGDLVRLTSYAGSVVASLNHSVPLKRGGHQLTVDASEARVGDSLMITPTTSSKINRDTGLFVGGEDFAWLLGFFCAEGSCVASRGSYYSTFSNKDVSLLKKARDICSSLLGKKGAVVSGDHRRLPPHQERDGGRLSRPFYKKDGVSSLRIPGRSIHHYFRDACYTSSKLKRVPNEVLNASLPVKVAFLRGYNAGDGAHFTPSRGHGGHRWDYEFQSFTTNSQVLAAGLVHLVREVLPTQKYSLRTRPDKPGVYSIRLLRPDSGREVAHRSTIHQKDIVSYDGYLYDLETEDHRFSTGIGPVTVHNTDLGWRLIDRFGEKSYLHAPDVRMVHPRQMQSQWDSRVEEKFYLRHRRRCLEEFAPVDPRLDQFVVQQGIEKAPEVVEYLNWLNDRFFGRARPRSGLFYACCHCELDFGKLSDYRAHLSLSGLSTTEVPQDGIRWYVPPDAQNYVPLEPHEANIVRWMEGRLPDPMHAEPEGTLIDVGAERGTYSIRLAKYFEKVFAVEPYQGYLDSIDQTEALNQIWNITEVSAAAWDHEGRVNLGRFPINKGAEWSASESEQGIQVVPAITVDSLGVKDCRLLKVDAEGQGVKVLRGAEETLKNTEMVLFEIHELGGSLDESIVGRKVLLGAGLERKAQWFQHGAIHELWSKDHASEGPA